MAQAKKGIKRPVRMSSSGLPKRARMNSLESIYGDSPVKFFKAGRQTIVSGHFIGRSKSDRYLLVSKLSGRTGKFVPIAETNLTVSSDGKTLVMHNVGVLSPHKIPDANEAKQIRKALLTGGAGLGLFGVFVYEARAFARKNNVKEIRIVPENKKLAEYYKRYGFKVDKKFGAQLVLNVR
ncbi:MAG: hypothetical protein ABID38_02985 [Candidatus Diapherotrites archaeon]